MSAEGEEVERNDEETEETAHQSGGESSQPETKEAGEDALQDENVESNSQPKANKRGGNRRSRKRRGGGAKKTVVDVKQGNSASEEIQPNDETEIEVTGHEKNAKVADESMNKDQDEDDQEEEEETREPSPVVTRRSNRKLQQQKEVKEEDVEDEPMEVDHAKETEVQSQDLLELDQDEVESVASELESIASSSTLTTRSRRPKSSQDTRPRRGRGKVVKKNGSSGTGPNVKGKSRRAMFKKSATRAPTAVAKAVTSDRVYFRGQYFTKGDIVSVEDLDGSVFYAQLRGFLTDQYCEKSGVISWLLPTTNSPKPEDGFDASTYVIGPEEDLPRKLDYFTFVMHAPDDYFYYKRAPYPTISVQADKEYLVTRQGPRVRGIKAGKAIYQDSVPPMIPVPSVS